MQGGRARWLFRDMAGSGQVGLRAAKAASMACLITTSAYTHKDDLKLADRVEASLDGVGLDAVMSLPRSMVGLNA